MELNEKAMLVQLTLSMWTGRKKDRVVAEEVTTVKKAERDGGVWWTYLVPRRALRSIYTSYGHCRSAHKKYTLPWNDSGCRILPSAMFMEYSKAMRDATVRFNEAVDEFLKAYPTEAKQAKKRLGKLLDGIELPTVTELKSKFGIKQEILPLPSAKDFRVDLTKDDVDKVKKQIQQTIGDAVDKAISDIWVRLGELVSKVQDTLGEKDKVFRDSLITNLKDFCILMPKLNFTGNKEIESMRKTVLASLTKLKPDKLREDPIARRKAAKKAEEVLKKIKSYNL